MNKIVIIAGEIATGPGLGSTSVIINKMRQRSVLPPPCRPRDALQPPKPFYINATTTFRAQCSIILLLRIFTQSEKAHARTYSKFCREVSQSAAVQGKRCHFDNFILV